MERFIIPLPFNIHDYNVIPVKTSYTPEDKFGPCGYDAPNTLEGSEKRFVAAGEVLNYRIEFWNKPDAPVPTQDALIKDNLDPNLFDLGTFEFTRFGFLKWDVPLKKGTKEIQTRLDLRPDMMIAVDVKATLDPDTGDIEWWFHCVEPMTGEYPDDPMAGFLPPYNEETGFEIGWVEFSVKPKEELPNGTEVANQAFVQFDFMGPFNPAPKEGPWINTVDCIPPESEILEFPSVMYSKIFTIKWLGEDNPAGSGVGCYDIYVSDNGSGFTLWETGVKDTQTLFMGDDGHTYSFYSIANDNVGNKEGPPGTPDASTSVDVLITETDIINHILGISIISEDKLYSADVNGDGDINIADLVSYIIMLK